MNLIEEILEVQLESQLKIEKVRFSSLMEQDNFVTKLQAEATGEVIKEIESQLKSIRFKEINRTTFSTESRIKVVNSTEEVKVVETSNSFIKPKFSEFLNYFLSRKEDASDEEVKNLYDKYEKLKWQSRYKPMKDWKMSVRVSIAINSKKNK